MNDSPPDVVRIGVDHARITRVTAQQVEYLDEAGQERSIDLEGCARNWCQIFDENRDNVVILPGAASEGVASWNAGCVGQRGAIDDPPWVMLMDDRRTRFEFKDYGAIYALLLDPLMEAGWHTFDAT